MECGGAYTGIQTHTLSIRQVPSRAECHSARLVLNGDNMLGLCNPSNLLLVLSAEERCALLKLLWGGLVNTTAAIATTFCVVINTTKYSSCVVPEYAPEIKDCRWPPFCKKLINCYILATVWMTLMKFCTTHIGTPNLNGCSKFQISKKIPRWQTAAILKKNVKRCISATVWPILMKFAISLKPFDWF